MHLPTYLAIALFFRLGCTQSASTNRTIVQIPYEDTYLLPDGYTYNLGQTFVKGTNTSDPNINSLLASAAAAPFISYDSSFSNLLGRNPKINLIATSGSQQDFYESGVWVPSVQAVYISANTQASPMRVFVLNLTTSAVQQLDSNPTIMNPDGAIYFEGLVYYTSVPGNTTYRGGIFSLDPVTNIVTPIVNSWFGLPFNGIDDIAAVSLGPKKKYLYFSSVAFPYGNGADPNRPVQPNAIWRFDLVNKVLIPVISKADIPTPNGIRVAPDNKTMYVTDSGSTSFSATFLGQIGGGPGASPAIYKYDIDSDGFPVNRRLFGYARTGLPDGLHIDMKGRVWTGEGEGIVVRSPQGKVLGVFNSGYFLAGNTPGSPAEANFALAGDTVVVFGVERLWTVKVNEMLTGGKSGFLD